MVIIRSLYCLIFHVPYFGNDFSTISCQCRSFLHILSILVIWHELGMMKFINISNHVINNIKIDFLMILMIDDYMCVA